MLVPVIPTSSLNKAIHQKCRKIGLSIIVTYFINNKMFDISQVHIHLYIDFWLQLEVDIVQNGVRTKKIEKKYPSRIIKMF